MWQFILKIDFLKKSLNKKFENFTPFTPARLPIALPITSPKCSLLHVTQMAKAISHDWVTRVESFTFNKPELGD